MHCATLDLNKINYITDDTSLIDSLSIMKYDCHVSQPSVKSLYVCCNIKLNWHISFYTITFLFKASYHTWQNLKAQ